jgi:hypothetical protein
VQLWWLPTSAINFATLKVAISRVDETPDHKLTLALLVLGILANYGYTPFAANHFALFADFLY